MNPAKVTCRPARNERGAVGGAETLAVGMLVLIATTLAFANVWALVETRVALDAAAREYMRTYTTAVDPLTASADAELSAREVLHRRGTPLSGLVIDAPDPSRFGPCEPVTVALSVSVAWAAVPFIDDAGARTVQVTHSELVDAHREMLVGPAHLPDHTPCARR